MKRNRGGSGQGSGPIALLPGTLEMLILHALAFDPMHAYGIGMHLERTSCGAFRVNAGSLYPAFRRLERDGDITAAWRTTENHRRAKCYSLTLQGRQRLAETTQDWQRQTAAILYVLTASLAEAQVAPRRIGLSGIRKHPQ